MFFRPGFDGSMVVVEPAGAVGFVVTTAGGGVGRTVGSLGPEITHPVELRAMASIMNTHNDSINYCTPTIQL